MSRVTELENALTTLFRKGTEVGYTETEIDEFLENIDYHALLQAVWNKAETVYAYRADGKNALSLDYRSTELFKQRATLLYYNIAAKCDKETMLQREYTPDCMDKRNRYMVDHADSILAVWNGCPSGTGNTVRYVHKKGKSIIVINPVSLDVTRE